MSQLHLYLSNNLDNYSDNCQLMHEDIYSTKYSKKEAKQFSGSIIFVQNFQRRSINKKNKESEFYIQYMLSPLNKEEIDFYDWQGKRLVKVEPRNEEEELELKK